MSVYWLAWSICRPAEEQLLRLELPGDKAVTFMDSILGETESQASLDKQWSAVHFLLTGKMDPFDNLLSWAVYGEHMISRGRIESYVSARTAQDIADALRDFSLQELLIKRSQEELIEEYNSAISGWRYRSPSFPWVNHLIAELRDFYDFTATMDRGVYIFRG